MGAISRSTVVVAAVLSMAGCESTRVVHHEPQFSLTLSVKADDPLGHLREYFVDWHMDETDLDCFMREAAEAPPINGNWKARRLNEIAAQCKIDLGELWKKTSGGDVI
jgi:hypothetical protein